MSENNYISGPSKCFNCACTCHFSLAPFVSRMTQLTTKSDVAVSFGRNSAPVTCILYPLSCNLSRGHSSRVRTLLARFLTRSLRRHLDFLERVCRGHDGRLENCFIVGQMKVLPCETMDLGQLTIGREPVPGNAS